LKNLIFFKGNELPAVYFTRYLAQKYLLEGKSQILKSDKDVKIFIKAIALECITNVVSILPNVVCMTLYDTENQLKNDNNNEIKQYLWDLLLYTNHSDDKMKTQITLLIGNLINTSLLQSDGNYDKWLEEANHANPIPGKNIAE
jgi:huntingtin